MSSTHVTAPIQVSSETDVWKLQKALEIKKHLEDLLFKTGTINITNKTRRHVKKMFNELVNLTDKMFQGFHSDGSPIGTLSDDMMEITMLYQILKKTPTLSFAKAERTIKKWISLYQKDSKTTYPSKKHELIIRAYEKYMEEVRSKKVTVKTRGLDLVEKCMQYWQTSEVDPVLEEQIDKVCNELRTLVLTSFDETFTFEAFVESLVPVLDISGSMCGKPIETGLFYLFVLVKVFGVKTIHYFESAHIVKTINPDYASNLDLIKQIYIHDSGSTQLASVFRYLNEIKTSNKNVVIITDGDCDPDTGMGSRNPFHEVTRLDKASSAYPNVVDCNFIVVNVRETELKFPYLNIDPRVCYLTGNNPKTLNGFIKALCESTKAGTMITPYLILKHTLNMDELILEHPIPKYSNVMTDERISTLFEVFQKNLPPKKPVEAVSTTGIIGDGE